MTERERQKENKKIKGKAYALPFLLCLYFTDHII